MLKEKAATRAELAQRSAWQSSIDARTAPSSPFHIKGPADSYPPCPPPPASPSPPSPDASVAASRRLQLLMPKLDQFTVAAQPALATPVGDP